MLRLRNFVYAMLASTVVAVPTVSGQVEPLEPVWKVVSAENGATLRSGDFDTFYKVAALKPGQLLRATGQSVGWFQVEYPVGLAVFVSEKQAEVSGTNRVRLTEDSKLLAPSMLLGLNGSWRTLFTEALPAGTELPLVDTITGVGDRVAGFAVAVPRNAGSPKGYVKAAEVRDATRAEIDAHLATLAESEAAEETVPDGAGETEVAATPGTDAASRDAETDIAAADDTAAESEALSLADDMVEPGEGEPAFVVTEDDVAENEVAEDVALARPADPGPATQEPVVDPRVVQLLELEQRLDTMRGLPQAEQDDAIEELLEAYQAAVATETNATNARRLNQRIQWLELKIDMRDQRRLLDQALADADERRAEAVRLAREFRSGRQYSAVGRIVPSIVYNGDRLPRMFRVQAVGGVGSRTIGYVRASDETDPAAYTGELVGIFGDVRYDEALRLNIITPERIELIPLAPAESRP